MMILKDEVQQQPKMPLCKDFPAQISKKPQISKLITILTTHFKNFLKKYINQKNKVFAEIVKKVLHNFHKLKSVRLKDLNLQRRKNKIKLNLL